jgi:hypothetical protein
VNTSFETGGLAPLGIRAPRLRKWAIASCILSAAIPLKVAATPLSQSGVCVSQAFDKLPREPSFSIRLEQIGAKPTDSPELYHRYMGTLRALADSGDGSPKQVTYFMTSPMYFKKHFLQWTHFGAGVLCAHPMGSNNNQCRNRTYTFRMSIPPEEIARIVMTDIMSSSPTIPKCPSRWVSGSPRPADSW